MLLGCGIAEQPSTTPAGTLNLSWETTFAASSGASDAVLSPSGERVALVNSGAISVQSTSVSGATQQPTTDSWQGHSPAWAPDGSRLAWVRGERLWIGDVQADNSVGASRPVSTQLPGLRSPAWSPEGDRIAVYAAAHGPEGSQDIYLVDLSDPNNEPATIQLTRSAAVGDDTRFTPQWSPNGRWIAYVSNQADWWHDDVWVVNVDTSEAQHLSTSFMASSSPVWSPLSSDEHATLVAMGTSKSGYWYQDLADLFRLDVDLTGTTANVTAEEPIDMQVHASDFIMRFDPYFSANGETVYFPFHERGAFDLWAVPTDGGVATRVTNVGGAWSRLSAAADGSAAVFVRDAATEGREAWMVSATGGPARALTRHSPRLAGLQVPKEVSFRTFDGLYLQGFLYLPPGLRTNSANAPESLRCPALVQVHGGGTNSYYQGTNLVEQVLAARGFAVLAINYRGGSGFGRAFQDLNVEDWLNDQSKDPGAAADWLRSQPWSNGKVGIYGGSYGGMQSMSAITRTPGKFDAAVPMRGIYSESLTLPDADRLGKIFAITGHGGTPDERPDTYNKSETLARMDAITAPVLIMHGERDVRAPFSNFELAVDRLEALGKTFEAKTYPEGHAFRDPANLIDMYSRLESFFTQHLGQCE